MSPAASGIHIKVKSNFGARFLQSQDYYRQLPMVQVIGLPAFANCPCPQFNSIFNPTPCHGQKAGLRNAKYTRGHLRWSPGDFGAPMDRGMLTKKADKSNPVQFKANDKLML